eukprot:SAG31_NODE_19176_length_610_cov_0.806262_1_plen_39_part_10
MKPAGAGTAVFALVFILRYPYDAAKTSSGPGPHTIILNL